MYPLLFKDIDGELKVSIYTHIKKISLRLVLNIAILNLDDVSDLKNRLIKELHQLTAQSHKARF